MKKVLFLTTLLLLSFTVTTFAQSSKEARAARREALKKEREEKYAVYNDLVDKYGAELRKRTTREVNEPTKKTHPIIIECV